MARGLTWRPVRRWHSEDPIAAARSVVSDAAALLWETVRDRHCSRCSQSGWRQLIRWESRWSWTRHGDGKVSEKETSLASVLARMLRARGWTVIADRYLA